MKKALLSNIKRRNLGKKGAPGMSESATKSSPRTVKCDECGLILLHETAEKRACPDCLRGKLR